MSSTVSRLSAAKPRVSRTGRVWMRLRDRRREVTEDGAEVTEDGAEVASAEDSENIKQAESQQTYRGNVPE